MLKSKLEGKTLLLMGGNAYYKGIKKYVEKNNIHTIAIGNISDTPLKKIATESYDIDTKDVEAIVKLVEDKKIDGMFVGATEESLLSAIAVSEKTGIRFYVNREQWEILANKRAFKKIASECGIPVPKEYELSLDFKREDLNRINYPVIVKPADGSGAKGLNGCYNEEELKEAFKYAMDLSEKKEVVVEEMITEAKEVFFLYTLQDENYSLSSAFTKSRVISDNNYVSLPIFHLYPSKYIPEYLEKVDPKAQKMFKELGMKNGVITLQGFYKDGEFCFFEAGYRMGGEQMYVLTDFFYGVNSLDLMLNCALTGQMEDYDISQRENAQFKFPCCNYYIPLKAGTISEIIGLGEVESMKNVLNVTEMCQIGDCIKENNSLSRVAFRLHVYGETAQELARVLVEISQTLQILDENGNEMQIEKLEYERCLDAIIEK